MTIIVTRRVDKRSRQRRRMGRNLRFRRASIIRPILSNLSTPWKQVLSAGSDDDFLVSLNFTKSLFLERLLLYFELERRKRNFGSPYRCKPKTRGRHPQLESVYLLGLALWYVKTKHSLFHLCPIFGIVPSSVGVWLDYALEVLLHVVKKKRLPAFEIRWPTMDEMKASALLLRRHRQYVPLLEGVFAVTDGARMPCADYTNVDLQNAYFEGYTQEVQLTNLFVWKFFGEIIHAAINFPGSWHDNKLAGASGLYFTKLSDEMTPPGYAVLGDSAFVSDTRRTNGKIVRARKTNETSDIPYSATLAAVDVLLQRAMPSERQSAEWGVRAFKGPFARLKIPLSPDSYKRYRLIRICCHLFNFRTRYVGLNHVRTSYARK